VGSGYFIFSRPKNQTAFSIVFYFESFCGLFEFQNQISERARRAQKSGGLATTTHTGQE